jgi:hypothetical protein
VESRHGRIGAWFAAHAVQENLVESRSEEKSIFDHWWHC